MFTFTQLSGQEFSHGDMALDAKAKEVITGSRVVGAV